MSKILIALFALSFLSLSSLTYSETVVEDPESGGGDMTSDVDAPESGGGYVGGPRHSKWSYTPGGYPGDQPSGYPGKPPAQESGGKYVVPPALGYPGKPPAHHPTPGYPAEPGYPGGFME